MGLQLGKDRSGLIPFTIYDLPFTIYLLMDVESIRSFCLSLPHVDEKVQWENDLLFRIGEKMFAVVALEPSHGVLLSFKCTPEKFAELVEQDGIIPAPYVARYHWVAFERFDALPERELKELLKNAYQLVRDKLPKKIRDGLESGASSGVVAPKRPNKR
jgi:predicted DNA-binding protein (MmcQ/YjbR family)